MTTTTATNTTYRLRFRGQTTRHPDAAPLYFRRTGRDRRHGWLRWQAVDDTCVQSPTEWRTLQGVIGFIEANPYIAEQFDIVEVK